MEATTSSELILTQPRWYKLKGRGKGGKNKSEISGEIQLQFSIVDARNPAASPEEIYKRFRSIILADYNDEDQITGPISRSSTGTLDDDDVGNDTDTLSELDTNEPEDTSDEVLKPGEKADKKKQKKKRLARLRKKSLKVRAYEFTGKDSGVAGIIFMEISKLIDLPPERNST